MNSCLLNKNNRAIINSSSKCRNWKVTSCPYCSSSNFFSWSLRQYSELGSMTRFVCILRDCLSLFVAIYGENWWNIFNRFQWIDSRFSNPCQHSCLIFQFRFSPFYIFCDTVRSWQGCGTMYYMSPQASLEVQRKCGSFLQESNWVTFLNQHIESRFIHMLCWYSSYVWCLQASLTSACGYAVKAQRMLKIIGLHWECSAGNWHRSAARKVVLKTS